MYNFQAFANSCNKWQKDARKKRKEEERLTLFPLNPSQKVCENTLQSQDPEVTLSHLYTVNGLSPTQVSIAFIAAILTSVITQSW